MTDPLAPTQPAPTPAATDVPASVEPPVRKEPAAPDPTRYGDWEKNGRCIDF